MEMSWYFSSLGKLLSLLCCRVFSVKFLLLFNFMALCRRCWCTRTDGLTVKCGTEWGTFLLCFSKPGTLMNSHFNQRAWLAPSPRSTTHFLPAATFANEKWEMGQFTAKGCFFLRDRDVEMENRGCAKADEGLNFSREKRRGEKKMTGEAWCWRQYECHLWRWKEVLELHFWPFTSLIQRDCIEEQLLIFPISLHEKSCSDIQQAETKGHVSMKKFASFREVWNKDRRDLERSQKNKASGKPGDSKK